MAARRAEPSPAGPPERRHRPGMHVALRAFRALERLGGVVLLVVLSPLLALIWLWVRLDSPGPALFRQERLGQGGRPFTLLKFRSMHVGEEGVPQARRAVVESGADPRITRAGRFLRRTSLDELPQLWSVASGHMCGVGPRPVLPEQRPAMPPWAERRFAVKPGLTGLAQVKGRRSLGWLQQLRWDCLFVRKDSVRLRLWIIVQTFVVLLRPETVYGEAGKNWRAYLPDDQGSDPHA
jgi:lipopolysaccharide/colanic/teichoic acid biosynthesis glycosyltransferase